MPMPERLDHVRVQLLHGTVDLSWETRELLLAELGDSDEAAAVRRAFVGSGTTSAVSLTQPQKDWLAERITLWAERVDVAGVPDAVWQLRNLLLNDVAHGAAE